MADPHALLHRWRSGGSFFAGLLLAFLAGSPIAATQRVGSIERQPVATPSTLVDGEQFARRLLSPLSGRDIARFLATEGRTLAAEPFAPDAFSVDLYVPEVRPERGYGLLVFIPPIDDFAIPPDWKPVLERRGIVLVQPLGAGNDADVFGRRIPAVLHAYGYATRRFETDPERRYVGGFSGGARLAQRVALGWPDEFRGSLQFAGSVQVGENLMPPPGRELLDLARGRSRFVLVSGSLDMPNRRNDGESARRFEALCFDGVRGFVAPRLDHWVPGARGFAKALDLLERPGGDAGVARSCRQALDATVSSALDAVEAHLAGGDASAARDALVRVDDRYGGLAVPRSLALAQRIEAALAAAR